MDGNGPACGPDVSTLSAEGRRALAAVWTETARAEHTRRSPLRFSSPVADAGGARRSGAPGGTRARGRAGGDSSTWRFSFALAAAYAGEPVAPGPLAELHGAPAVTARSLTELAEESLVDGCLHRRGGGRPAAAASLQVRGGYAVARRPPSSRATKHHTSFWPGRSLGLVLEAGRRGPSPAAAEAGPPHALRQAAPRAAAAARERKLGRARLPRSLRPGVDSSPTKC